MNAKHLQNRIVFFFKFRITPQWLPAWAESDGDTAKTFSGRDRRRINGYRMKSYSIFMTQKKSKQINSPIEKKKKKKENNKR